jgi:hypothetical protein
MDLLVNVDVVQLRVGPTEDLVQLVLCTLKETKISSFFFFDDDKFGGDCAHPDGEEVFGSFGEFGAQFEHSVFPNSKKNLMDFEFSRKY